MYSKRRARIAAEILGGAMKKDIWARLYGQLVYKQKKSAITPERLAALQYALEARGLVSRVEANARNYYLRILASDRPPRRDNYILHLFLLLLTVVTTSMVGAQFIMRDPFNSWADFFSGLDYSLALLSILLVHEMGHYLAARYHGITVTLPYFIPFYIPAFHPGTFGAFIKIKSPIPDRRALFDVGVAGPLAGVVMSIFFLWLGFSRLPDQQSVWAFLETLHPMDQSQSIALTLGDNLLFDFIKTATGKSWLPMSEIYHFPYIFAGWFGLLVTAINLMPIGQLDGGHITYALFGERAGRIALLAFALLVFLNIYLISRFDSAVYVLWTILILVFIRFKHPPTLDESLPLTPGRRLLGYLSYVVFIVTFTPLPIYIA